MKKTMILAAFAALVSLASCQKEDITDNGTEKSTSPVFTASIAGATKTTIDMTDGNVAKIAWETTDEITVTDASYASAVYTIESIDAITGKATFVIKSGETSLGDGPYTAAYGTEPATVQTYSATAGKLYMTAPETSNNSFTFTVQCGLMKLNLTKTGESVKSIAVTGTPTGGSETTYTLTCNPAQSIATAKDFFIALPAGSYTKIEITNAEDVTCTLNSASGVAVAANHIKPVTFDGSKLNFVLNIPDGALPGVFSVSATKKVYFSKGNLTYNVSTTTWAFYEHQYDCASAYDSNLISLFTWGYDATKSIVSDGMDYVEGHGTDGESFNKNEDWGYVFGGESSVWRTLSKDEWCYLFADDPNNPGFDTSSPRYNLFKYGVTVCGKTNCVVIAPDDWDISTNPLKGNYDSSTWPAAETAGLVCLPAAGYRLSYSVDNAGEVGSYWSSTAYDSDYAYYVNFYGNDVNPDYDNERSFGNSVRLVTDVTE